MEYERSTGNTEECLRNSIRHGTKASSQAAGEYGNGQHHQERTTLGPSKSKRNRTSSNPASAIVCRSQLRSAAQNIRKPPAPAPTNVPPLAPVLIASEDHLSS